MPSGAFTDSPFCATLERMNKEAHAMPIMRAFGGLLMFVAILAYLTFSMTIGDHLPPSAPEAHGLR